MALDCENNRIEIRTTPNMGLGIFARTNILNGRVLGEYLGDLRPLTDDPDHIDHYQFTMNEVAVICESLGILPILSGGEASLEGDQPDRASL